MLDTHIWLWWINKNDQLKPSHLEKIEQENQVGVSAISLFEVSWLVNHKKLNFLVRKKNGLKKH